MSSPGGGAAPAPAPAVEGDVLGVDEFEHIVPSEGAAVDVEAPEALRPAEAAAAAPAGDEFEDILPSGEHRDVVADLHADHSADHRDVQQKLQLARTASQSRYADKVKAKRRARNLTQGDYSRQAERATRLTAATSSVASHGSVASVIDAAHDETVRVSREVSLQRSASNRRYADKVARKRLRRGLTEGNFARDAFGLERRKRCCGFTGPQFIGLAGFTALPLLDAVTDWMVTIRFAISGDYGWLAVALSIQFVLGTVLGLMLSEELKERSHSKNAKEPGSAWRLPCAGCWGVLLGMGGLSPTLQSCVNLKDRAAKSPHPRADIRERSFKESVGLNCIPMTCLQMYVGVAYGRLDATDAANFDGFLALSVMVSIVASGTNSFATERLFRNEVLMGVDDDLAIGALGWYGLVTIVWRATQVAAMVGWIALLGCKIKFWAVIPAAVLILYYIEMQGEPDGQRSSLWPPFLWALGFVGLLFVVAAAFFSVAAADNNCERSNGRLGLWLLPTLTVDRCCEQTSTHPCRMRRRGPRSISTARAARRCWTSCGS